MNRLVSLLSESRLLITDGGMGSELQARGARVIVPSRYAAIGRAWTSAMANLESPTLVAEVHADYLRVGADLVISNNFSTAPSHLKWFGLETEWLEYTRAGIDIAVRTRDAVKPNAAVIGGFAAPGSVERDKTTPLHQIIGGEPAFKSECRAMGEELAGRGADAIVVEVLQYASDAAMAAEALEDLGIPVFLGMFASNDSGGLASGEAFERLVERLAREDGKGPTGIFLHCGHTAAIDAGIPKLVKAFGGVVGAYGNVGYDSGAFLSPEERGNWFNTHGQTPFSFANQALGWADAGARIVGGCCATGPEHILMLRALLDEKQEGTASTMR